MTWILVLSFLGIMVLGIIVILAAVVATVGLYNWTDRRALRKRVKHKALMPPEDE